MTQKLLFMQRGLALFVFPQYFKKIFIFFRYFPQDILGVNNITAINIEVLKSMEGPFDFGDEGIDIKENFF